MKTKIRLNKSAALYKKHGIWIGLAVVLLFAWAVFIYIYKGAIVTAAQSWVTKTVITENDEDKCYFTPENGKLEIHQGFFSNVEQLSGLRLVVETVPDVTQVQTVQADVKLLDGVTKEVLYQNTVSTQIQKIGYLSVPFDEPIKDTQDQYYELIIRFIGDDVESLRVVGTTNEIYETWASLLNDRESPGALRIDQYIEQATFLISLYKLFVFLFSVFIVIFYILTVVKTKKIETVYLFTVLALGFFYCFVIIPFAVPDESMHASTVYRISNEIMGVPDTSSDGTIYKRTDDAATELNNDCNLYQYYIVYDQLFSKVGNADLYETGYRDTGVSPILYAPAVVGVTAGRLLGLGTVPMYMLARLLTLLAFSMMTWWAMKKLPFGKSALFIICVLPMTLQQAASVSYDAIVNGVTILFAAVCFSMAFRKESLKKTDIVLTAVLGIILIMAKSGAYLPLVLLIAMIPAAKFGGQKRKWIVFGCFCGMLMLIFLMNSIGLVVGDTTSQAISTQESDFYSLGYILTHPGVVFNVGMGTFLLNSGYYISTMIGQKLGFLNIYLDDIVVYSYLLLLGLSALATENDTHVISIKQKTLMFAGIAFSTALVLLSMWLFITPKNSGVIMGVQGRYFIPLLWPVLMLFRNKLIIIRKNIDTGLIIGAVFLHIMVFSYIFRSVFLG